MRNGVSLKSITFNDGTNLPLDVGSIVVLTGPNNCGKSQCLKDIVFHWVAKKRSSVVIKDLDRNYLGDLKLAMRFDDLKEAIEDESNPRIRNFIETNGINFNESPFSIMEDVASVSAYLFRDFLNGFVTYLSTSSRLLSFSENRSSYYGLSLK